MRLDTKMVRNLGFVGMLAVLPLAQSKVLAIDCGGPDWCASLCPLEGTGGWIYQHGCTECNGSGCTCCGSGCADWCGYCGGSWSCI